MLRNNDIRRGHSRLPRRASTYSAARRHLVRSRDTRYDPYSYGIDKDYFNQTRQMPHRKSDDLRTESDGGCTRSVGKRQGPTAEVLDQIIARTDGIPLFIE
jgi:hypothetical protein